VAGKSGVRSEDYLVKINNVEVFNLNHDEAKQLIANSGNTLILVVER